jgi:hypothetical protein
MKQAFLVATISAVSAMATNLWIQPTLRSTDSSVAPISAVTQSEVDAILTEDHVIDLPEDGHTWHTILILRSDWRTNAAETKAESMFHSEPLLVSLKHQTHWHLITTDQAEFQVFRPLVSATPCLIVERANGEVVYRESSLDLGKRPHALTHSIRREIQRHCPDGRCLPLHPVPDRDQERGEPDEVPAVLREQPQPSEKKLPLAAVFSALAGLAGGVAANWKKTG